ncbi:MAG: response regulator transcription factor [Verrucomicrobia bacterium]|nr:response regulator transcription factor [Verrucomicrobiota bacterium]
MSIRVAIVEDDVEVRDGLAWLFRNSPGFECVAACGSSEEALRTLPPLGPDVVLLDIHLPGKSGIDCLPLLKTHCPATQVSMLTVFEDDDLIFRSLAAGATGYLLKKTPPAGILDAVRDLHAGGSPMSSQIARKVVNALAHRGASPAPETAKVPPPAHDQANDVLCRREREILDRLGRGHRYKEIADELGITIHTVRTFIRRMYEKLHVHSRTEALIKVRGQG